jgi:hypothetical protein
VRALTETPVFEQSRACGAPNSALAAVTGWRRVGTAGGVYLVREDEPRPRIGTGLQHASDRDLGKLPGMRAVGLVLAGVLATTTPLSGHAAGPGSNMRPADRGPVSNIELVWDDGVPAALRSHGGASQRTAASHSGTGERASAHWGQNRQYGGSGVYGAAVPTYWLWVPGSAIFDYPFPDWRGSTGGWGNPIADGIRSPSQRAGPSERDQAVVLDACAIARAEDRSVRTRQRAGS